MKKWMTIGALAFAVVAADASFVSAQDGFVDENGDGVDDGAARVHRMGKRGGMRALRSQLSDEQRAQVKAAIESLKESGATREEIRAAMATLFAGYGVEPSESGDHLARRLGSVLTEDQLAEVRAKIDELKASETSRSDIREAVGSLLEGYGVERPTRSERPGSLLTADQRTALRAEIDALRGAGASRAEIRAAFEARLGEFGVDPSSIRGDKRRGDKEGRHRGAGRFGGRRGGSHAPAPAPAEGAAVDDAS